MGILGKVVRDKMSRPLANRPRHDRTALFASQLLFDVVVYGLREIVLRPNVSIPLCQHVVLDESKAALSGLL